MNNNYFNIFDNNPDLSVALREQKNKMNERVKELQNKDITKKDIAKLKKQLTKEFKRKPANQQDNNNQTNTNIEDIMKAKLMDIYGITKNDLSSNGPSFSFSDLNKLVKIRKEIYELLKKKESLNKEDIIKLNTLFQMFSQIYSKKNGDFGIDISDEDSLGDKIKEALKSASFKEISGSTLRGEFGETLVAYVGAKIQDKAKETLDKYLEESIVGSKTSKFQVTTSQIPERLGLKINEQYSKKQQYNIYDIRASQDKVDVIISESDNSKVLRTSIKTYQSEGQSIKPHLQNVSLFYNLLATETNFSNHWLYLHYATDTSIKKGNLIDSKKEYDDELTKQILYEALVSGNLLKQQFSNQNSPETANYIIILDSKTGKVIIKSTYNLLNEAFHNNNNGWSPFIIKPDIYSIKFSRMKLNSSSDAISLHLIRAVQRRKISVSLKQNIS